MLKIYFQWSYGTYHAFLIIAEYSFLNKKNMEIA
jgi:hypothetical protein